MTSTFAREGLGSRAVVVPADLPGPSGGSAYDARMVTELSAAGLAVADEQVPGAWPHPDAEARGALRRVLARHDDVLVDGIIGSAAPEELEEARARGVRVAVLVHLPLPAEGGTDPQEQARLADSERRALHAADTAVATSRWARTDLQERYDLAEVHAVAPGTDVAEVATGSTPPHLLLLGSVTPRKNQLALLRALGGLRDRRWTASLVGPTPDPGYAEAVRDAAAALDGRVRLLGALAGDALEQVWRATDLLVLPSQAETYGMVVSEALAHGIPALVPAGTGAVEALQGSGERDGLPPAGGVVTGHGPDAWAQALTRWLDDPELRRHWRAAAAQHREKLRGWAEAATELRTVLRW